MLFAQHDIRVLWAWLSSIFEKIIIYVCLECTTVVVYPYLSVSILNWLGELFCTLMNCFACHNDLQLKCINLQDVRYFSNFVQSFSFNFSEPFDGKFHVYQKRKRFQPNLYSMMCKFGSYQINSFENMSVCPKELQLQYFVHGYYQNM